MIHNIHFKYGFFLQNLVMGCLALLSNILSAQTESLAKPESEARKSVPQIRVICVGSLAEDQEVVIASRDKEGNWQEHSTVKLRASSFSDWLPAASGEVNLTTRGNAGSLTSVCRFTYPEGTKRAILVILPDPAKNIYHGDLFDPASIKFAKGSTLLINYSSLVGTVKLGARQDSVNPGERKVVTPAPDPNGMFRMLIARSDKVDKELVICYDKYIGYNQTARTFLLLFPDMLGGLRVFSLPEFGPFE